MSEERTKKIADTFFKNGNDESLAIIVSKLEIPTCKYCIIIPRAMNSNAMGKDCFENFFCTQP